VQHDAEGCKQHCSLPAVHRSQGLALGFGLF
jgi:hypothetical protein